MGGVIALTLSLTGILLSVVVVSEPSDGEGMISVLLVGSSVTDDGIAGLSDVLHISQVSAPGIFR